MKKKTPMLSIIVPVYNCEKTIEKCVDSILKQNYLDFELILINDGSTDNTLEKCMRYVQIDDRVKLRTQSNKGLVSARMAGVNMALGDLIGFVDGDDWIEKEMYAELIKIYMETGSDLVSSGIYRDYAADGYTIEVCDNYEQGLYCDLKNQIYPTMLWNDDKSDFGLYCTLVNKIYRKQILQDVYKTIDTRVFYGEDCLTLFSYIMKISSMYILKKSFYHYNILNGSMCRKENEGLALNTYYLYKGLEKIFSNQGELRYLLLRQLRRYILEVESHTLKMLYNISVDSMGVWNYDYPELKHKNVVLYGAGGSSAALYKYLQNQCNVVAWVDKYPEDKDKLCLHKILPAVVIEQLQYDYIVISVLKEELAFSIKRELIEKYKVPDEKILWKEAEHISIFDSL